MITETREFDLSNTEIREQADGWKFRGYAAVFNALSKDLGGYKETILPGSFTRTLKEQPDVRFLVNHDPTKILARTPRTLQVHEDQTGLAVDASLPNTSYGRDLAESLSRGDISQMSFRFRIKKDSWEMRDNTSVRSLSDVDLVEVSAVTFPAYEGAEGTLEQRMLETAIRSYEEFRAGKAISNANRQTIMAVMKQLQDMLDSQDMMNSVITNPKLLKLDLREREFRF